MGLRDVESGLPPGFRFFPSDEELVCHYLHKKVARLAMKEETMVEIDLHTCEPWELPEVAKLSVNEWYFFSFRDRKYATGSRTNRATKSGYWKATGKDRTIYKPSARNEIIGMRKTLVFYSGRAPNGIKSSWVMHEFRLENSHSLPKEDWVLCRVFNKRKEEEGSAITSSSSSPLLSRDCPMEGRMYKHIGPLLSGDDHNNSYLCPTYQSIGDFNDMSNLMSFNVPQAEIEDFGFLMDVGL